MIALLKKYLKKNNFSDLNESFEDLFMSHPNYPSLFAITDTFNLLNLENIAAKVPKEQIIELPDSFLTYYKEELVLVLKSSEEIKIETENNKISTVNYNEFLKFWNGIVIAIEPNSAIKPITNNNFNWLTYVLPFAGLLFFSFSFNNYQFLDIAFLFIGILGLIISVFIIQEKLGIKNEISSKFCNLNTNVSCNSVITSGQSSLNKYVNFSDLPLLFFAINVFSILIQPKNAVYIIGLLSAISVPFILYSVWLQKFKIKKWCVLCLIVGLLIVGKSLLFLYTTTSFFVFYKINYSVFLFSVVLVSSIWFFIKPLLETKFKLESDIINLKKFKRSYDIFNYLSKKIEKTTDFNNLKGIMFGNENAKTKLTVILSPSCGHCHKAFNDGYELYRAFPENFCLNVLFNINPENIDNPYKVIVESLLIINELDSEKAKEAIIDWHINKFELQQWKNKWTVSMIDEQISEQILDQYNWCTTNNFNYTPIKIINNFLFPDGYEIEELKYFINNFSEETQNNMHLQTMK